GTVEDLAQRLPDDGGTAAGRATYLLLDGVDRGEVALHGFRDDRPGQAQVGRLPAEVHGRPGGRADPVLLTRPGRLGENERALERDERGGTSSALVRHQHMYAGRGGRVPKSVPRDRKSGV